MPGCKYCPRHGQLELRHKKKRKVKDYLLTVYQARLDEVNGPQAKSLREEAAILRLLIEARINSCKSDWQLHAAGFALADLIDRLARVVRSCARLETRGEEFLDKPTLRQIGQRLLEVLARHVADEALFGKVADGIVSILAEFAARK
jgi:hypothetical protein